MTNPYNAGIIAGDITVTHDGPPVVTPAPGQHVIVLDGLTPDEVRVITGLVRAMREDGAGRIGDTWPMDLRGDALTFVAGAMQEKRATPGLLASGAWHIAHAISQMGES